MAGVLNKKYYDQRQNRIDFRYRLNRRTHEVKKIIEKLIKNTNYSNLRCLDIGAADGLMLGMLNDTFKFQQAIGIDLSEELIACSHDVNITLKIGNAENLHFENGSFDIVIACAVIEHVNNPSKMLSECFRILKPGGTLIITTPNPFQDKIAMKVGYGKEEEHNETFNLSELKDMLKSSNFEIMLAKHFMFFPFFKLPLENTLESIINFLGCGNIMSNQLIVGKKINFVLKV